MRLTQEQYRTTDNKLREIDINNHPFILWFK